MEIKRRPFVAALLGLPVVSVVADWGTSDEDQRRKTPEYQQYAKGIAALRLINTAFLRHQQALGYYPELTELSASEPVRQWLGRKEVAETYGPVFQASDFNGPEILPGWMCEFKLSSDRSGYLVMLRDTTTTAPSETAVPALATDERGTIYQGQPSSTITFAASWNAEELVIGHGIRVTHHHHREGGFASAVKSLAMGVTAPVHADAGGSCDPCCGWIYCCCESWCNCFGCMHCQSGHPGAGNCSNCGCACCPWCCC